MRRMLPFVLVALFAGSAVAFAVVHHPRRHHRHTTSTVGSDPLLLGSDVVQSSRDGGTGTSEAFGYPATVTGTVTNAEVYLDSTDGVRIGLYADAGGLPGARLDRGTVSSNDPGWVSVPLTAGVQVTAGTLYWIAIASTSPTHDGRLPRRW